MIDIPVMGTRQLLGEKLRVIIAARNLQKKEVAVIFGVSAGQLSNYLNGDSAPSIERLKAFADKYGVSLDYLLSDDPVAILGVDTPAVARPAGAPIGGNIELFEVMQMLERVSRELKERSKIGQDLENLVDDLRKRVEESGKVNNNN